MRRFLACLSAIVFFSSCAQVPRESVELSATIGRDLTEVQKAHVQTITLLFDRIRIDINTFVDEVYVPYQISTTLAQEQASEPDEDGLFSTLHHALSPESSPEDQRLALDFMEVFVQELRADIDSFRDSLMAPVEEQERQVLTAVNDSYEKLHNANSIVTGHLASIVQVHEAQDEILARFGVHDLRTEVGSRLADSSRRIHDLVEQGRKLDGHLDSLKVEVPRIKSGILDSIQSNGD